MCRSQRKWKSLDSMSDVHVKALGLCFSTGQLPALYEAPPDPCVTGAHATPSLRMHSITIHAAHLWWETRAFYSNQLGFVLVLFSNNNIACTLGNAHVCVNVNVFSQNWDNRQNMLYSWLLHRLLLEYHHFVEGDYFCSVVSAMSWQCMDMYS